MGIMRRHDITQKWAPQTEYPPNSRNSLHKSTAFVPVTASSNTLKFLYLCSCYVVLTESRLNKINNKIRKATNGRRGTYDYECLSCWNIDHPFWKARRRSLIPVRMGHDGQSLLPAFPACGSKMCTLSWFQSVVAVSGHFPSPRSTSGRDVCV